MGVRGGLYLVVFGREESRGLSARIADVLPPKSVVGSDSERAADDFKVALFCEERDIDLLIIPIDLVEKGFQVREHALVCVAPSCWQS